MKRIIGFLAVVALAATVAAVAVSCATSSSQPEHHGKLTATRGGGYETQTLYSCVAATGYQIVFDRGKWFVSALVRNSGVIWVKPHSPQDTSGTIPLADAGTNPVPTDAGIISNGWARLGDGQTVSYGIELPSSAAETSPSADQIYFLDVWCETQGDLVVIAH